jgi:release factor glutamine methyltransferase
VPPVSLFLFQGAGRLQSGPHPERARADAELLLMHLLRAGRAWLIAHSDAEIGSDQWEAYLALLQRRRNGEPIQYITGEQEFYGLPFRVTPDVLIPRPETEHLVEKAIELATEIERPRIVDVGTGSGAIAVALACKMPEARVTALDISAGALEVARGNAQRNAVAERIDFKQSDLLDAVGDARFDFVVSNPPYVPTADRDSLSVEVREHEPGLALFAGEDGLDVYRRLIPAALRVLVASGYLLMEIGYGQSAAVAALLTDAGFGRIEFVPDLQGIPRVACAQRPV